MATQQTRDSAEVTNQEQQQEKQDEQPNQQQKQQQQQQREKHKPQQSHKQQSSRPKRKKPGFHDEMFEETSYYFKKGLRFVYPYAFTFTAHIKQRWLGLELLQLFQREFHMETVEYYETAIKEGKIRVNDKKVGKDRVLTSKDILKTTVHRHEPPVIHEPIEFLLNDEYMVVINKPPSIPVHPCGRYRHNTIVFILGKEHGLHRLHTIHRIDRLTSGILMFAKTATKAKEMEASVHGRNVQKEYLARVVGDFPSEVITVDEPIITMSHKIGVCRVDAQGKQCCTSFTKVSFNGKSSLVKCKPLTGRMHQIRVHLQWLGHAIVNDPIYNHLTAWGEGKGKRGTTVDVKKVVAELIRTRKDKSYDDGEEDAENPETSSHDAHTLPVTSADSVPPENPRHEESAAKKMKFEEDGHTTYTSLDLGEDYFDASCTECKRAWKEPFKSELVMYLHALTYKGPDWEYKTTLPEWASDTWDKD